MNRTFMLILAALVIGLVVGATVAPSFIAPQQVTVTRTVTLNATKLVTATVEHTLTPQQMTTTITVTAAPEQTTTVQTSASTQEQSTVTETVTSMATTTVSSGVAGSLVQYCFSPGGHCDQVLVGLINQANTSIHILIYSFTLDDVSNALIQARDRGVDVKIVMEKDNANGQGSEYQPLKQAGMDIRLDSNSALMHDKFAVIDNHIVITGSYNWTSAATTSNNENLAILDSMSWAAAYEAQFQSVYGAATP